LVGLEKPGVDPEPHTEILPRDPRGA